MLQCFKGLRHNTIQELNTYIAKLEKYQYRFIHLNSHNEKIKNKIVVIKSLITSLKSLKILQQSFRPRWYGSIFTLAVAIGLITLGEYSELEESFNNFLELITGDSAAEGVENITEINVDEENNYIENIDEEPIVLEAAVSVGAIITALNWLLKLAIVAAIVTWFNSLSWKEKIIVILSILIGFSIGIWLSIIWNLPFWATLLLTTTTLVASLAIGYKSINFLRSFQKQEDEKKEQSNEENQKNSAEVKKNSNYQNEFQQLSRKLITKNIKEYISSLQIITLDFLEQTIYYLTQLKICEMSLQFRKLRTEEKSFKKIAEENKQPDHWALELWLFNTPLISILHSSITNLIEMYPSLDDKYFSLYFQDLEATLTISEGIILKLENLPGKKKEITQLKRYQVKLYNQGLSKKREKK